MIYAFRNKSGACGNLRCCGEGNRVCVMSSEKKYGISGLGGNGRFVAQESTRSKNLLPVHFVLNAHLAHCDPSLSIGSHRPRHSRNDSRSLYTMAPRTRTIYQNLIDDDYDPIVVQEDILESKLTKETFDDLFKDLPTPRFVGLAPIYTDSGTLTRLAVAVRTKIIVIQFHAKGKGAAAYKGREILSSEVLCNPDVLLLAFSCDKLAIALYHDQNIRVRNAIDVQSACSKGRQPLAAIAFAAGDDITIMKENIQATFESSTWDSKRVSTLALQAWVAQCLPSFPAMEDRFQAAKRIDTFSKTDAVRSTAVSLGH